MNIHPCEVNEPCADPKCFIEFINQQIVVPWGHTFLLCIKVYHFYVVSEELETTKSPQCWIGRSRVVFAPRRNILWK
jgi:hypothetical protein